LFGNSIFLEAPFPAAFYVSIAERRALRVYRHTPMAVVSGSTKQELVGHGFNPDNIALVHNAVDHSLYSPGQEQRRSSSTLHIGYLGRIKKYKSVDHVLKAFAVVHRELPNTTLTIVGDGDVKLDLERLANNLGIINAVQFTGHVPSQKKVELLRSMDIVVNPSAKEGWGLTVIEANACGVPVVASNVPGLRDSVVDGTTGLLYEYGNIDQLVQKMLTLLRYEESRKAFSAAAIEWAGKFQWERSADAMEQVLQKVVANRSLLPP